MPINVLHPMVTSPLGTSEAGSIFWKRRFENRVYQKTTRRES